MEPNLSPEPVQDNDLKPTQQGCANCGSSDILAGYPTPLCASCRQAFVKYPFPVWIKAFGIGIGVVVLFSCYSFFGNLQPGIHLERGKKAERSHHFRTAQHEFEEVLKKVPDNVEALGHLVIAAYYNMDFNAMTTASAALEGKTIEDRKLYDEASYGIYKANEALASDSLTALYSQYKDASPAEVTEAVDTYYLRHPDDKAAAIKVASDAIDAEHFSKADSVLQKVIDSDPDCMIAINMMTAVKRREKKADEAIRFIDRMLEFNSENTYALSSKARVLVMIHRDDEALHYAEQVKKIDAANAFNLATLAIVFHYMGKMQERDKLIASARVSKDTSAMEYMQYAVDIVNQKERLRD